MQRLCSLTRGKGCAGASIVRQKVFWTFPALAAGAHRRCDRKLARHTGGGNEAPGPVGVTCDSAAVHPAVSGSLSASSRLGGAAPSRSFLREPVAQKALRIDRVRAKPLAKALAQFANVTFDYVLVDAIVEQPIDEIKDL